MNLSSVNVFWGGFRLEYIHDYNFWFISLGFSYWFLIIFFRSWTIKSFKALLWIAIGFCIIGNIFGFVIFKTGSMLGALNGPLITLITYRLLYEWFIKKYNKPPASPISTFFSMDRTLMKDGLLNAAFVMVSIFSITICSVLTCGKL